MLAEPQSVLTGIFQLVLVSLVPVILFGIWLNHAKLAETGLRLGRQAGIIAPLPPRPIGRPLEQVAADIRRLAVNMDSLAPRAPRARRLGVVMAYDDALAAACKQLDVRQNLTDLPLGMDRDVERIRVESQLEYAGLRLRPPRAA